MSQITTQFVGENISPFEGTNNVMMGTPHYLIGDNTYRMPSMTIFESPVQLDENSHSSNSYVQTSTTVYPASYQIQNNEPVKSDANGCWSGVPNNQAYAGFMNEPSKHPNFVPMTPMMQSQAFFQQAQIQKAEDNLKKLVFMNGGMCDNGLPGFTMIQQPSCSNTQNFWRSNENFEIVQRENDISMQCSDMRTFQQAMNPDAIPRGVNYMCSMPNPTNSNFINCNSKSTDTLQFPKFWLIKNFERVNEDVTMARSAMYSYYLYACHEYGENPMNSAGLGKIIRSVFGPIKNRRLGSRGDSRYHYLGIKIKDNSPILNVALSHIGHIVSTVGKTSKNQSSKPKVPDVKGVEFPNGENFGKMTLKNLMSDLKYMEELELKPLSTFNKNFQDILKFNINIEADHINQGFTSEKSISIYSTIFNELIEAMNEHSRRIIENFKNFDEDNLSIEIHSFWKKHRQFPWPNYDDGQNLTMVPLSVLTNDDNVVKYIVCFDYAFLPLLAKKAIGDIKAEVSANYLDKIILLFKVMDDSLQECLLNFPPSFAEQKLACIKSCIQIVEDFKSLNQSKYNLIKRLLDDNTEAITVYNICSSMDFSRVIGEFRTKNEQLLNMFQVKLECLEEFFIKLALFPIQNNCHQWLPLMEEHLIRVYNQKPTSEACVQFLKEWCAYHSLLMEYLDSSQENMGSQLLLYQLSIRWLSIFSSCGTKEL